MDNKKKNNSQISSQNFGIKPILVFWFDAPPRAGAGAFKIVTERWGNNVHYFCLRKLRDERLSGGWREANHGNAKITYFDELTSPEIFVEEFVKRNPDAIHIFNGFRSKTSQYMDKYIRLTEEPKIVVWSERPGIYGNKMEIIAKKLYHPLIHRMYYFKYSKKIKALMPLGKLGVEVFSRYGWKRSMMFSFMYDPPMPNITRQAKKRKKSTPIKILYIGRFARSTKGIDILINAFNLLNSSEWRLSLVGGYGEYKDFTINWANKMQNVEFLGTWPSDKVTEKISDYDLVIVPSRFDGWNVVTNEAIRAGVGVIASNETVSHELIEASKAGIVFDAGDVNELYSILSNVMNESELINVWKERAEIYSHKITSEVVGMYLIELLEYIFINKSGEKPSCPWT